MYILSLFYFFKEIKSQLWQERAGSLRRPPQCWEFIDSTGSLSLLSPAVYSLAAPRVFGQPPSASGFDVWCRLSSGQVVVAVAWASLTKCQEGCPVCNIHFHSLSPEAEAVFVSATSGRPDCSAVSSSGVPLETGLHSACPLGGGPAPLCGRRQQLSLPGPLLVWRVF